MKLNVVYDRDGRLKAAAVVPEVHGVLLIRPRPNKDQTAAEIEVPEEHRGLDLDTFCKSFRVDTSGDRPRFVRY